MRRVMREMNLYTYYGPPMGFHARTQRDPLKDLKAEMWGMEHVAAFAHMLDGLQFNGLNHVVSDVRHIWNNAAQESYIAKENIDCALLFLDDMEGVL